MFEKILVPVDGSTTAERLISWAANLAVKLQAEAVLLAVADPVEWIPWPPAAAWGDGEGSDPMAAGIDPYPDPGSLGHSMKEFQARAMERALDNANKYLGRQAEKIRGAGGKVSVDVRQGSPTDVIPQVISEEGIGLVAMSSRQTSAFARGVLGSVADRVVRSSTVPVIIMHPEYIRELAEAGIETIIVTLEGSEFSEAAAEPGIAMALALKARILFMRVLDTGVAGDEPNPDVQDSTAEYLGQFVETAQAEGLQANSRIVSGDAARAILDETGSVSTPLVVMGTHGRGGFRRFLIGSVADKVVRSANVPIMVVPPTTSRQ